MATARHPVYRSLNRPLTIWGADRRLFFLAIVMGGATFNAFQTLVGGVVMFVALYGAARWASATDPEILRILFRSARARRRYDPGKCAAQMVETGGC